MMSIPVKYTLKRRLNDDEIEEISSKRFKQLETEYTKDEDEDDDDDNDNGDGNDDGEAERTVNDAGREENQTNQNEDIKPVTIAQKTNEITAASTWYFLAVDINYIIRIKQYVSATELNNYACY